MHLKQPLLNARVDAGGDDALDLHAFACKGVLTVSVAVVRSDAAGVPQRGSGQVTHGVFGARELATPQELEFEQCLVELGEQVLCDSCGRVETSRERASSVRVSYSAKIGWLGGAEGSAEVVNHGGDQGATHDAVGHEGGKGGSKGRAEALVACEKE